MNKSFNVSTPCGRGGGGSRYINAVSECCVSSRHLSSPSSARLADFATPRRQNIIHSTRVSQ